MPVPSPCEHEEVFGAHICVQEKIILQIEGTYLADERLGDITWWHFTIL
jgi:hypothetical protein